MPQSRRRPRGGGPSACAPVREALSAALDGEEMPLAAAEVRDHLAACPACGRYAAAIEPLNRLVRVGQADAVPDLTAPILEALARPGVDPRAAGRRRQLRGIVALAGMVQLLLAVPVLVGLAGPDLHLGRELGSLQLALGIGFLVAAAQPRRAPGLLPVAAVVALAAVVTGVIDVVAGRATLLAELPHLAELVGVAALWRLTRHLPPDAAAPVGRAVEAGA